MTRKDRSSVNTNAPITNGMKSDTEGERWKQQGEELQQREVEKDIGASRDSGNTDSSLNGIKALEPNFRHKLLVHAFWAIFAWLLVMFAVNDFKLAPIAASCSSASSVMENNGATTISPNLSQDIDSSSSLLGSHATRTAPKISEFSTLSPQNRSLISNISSTCSCLVILSTVGDGPVTVTFTTTVSATTVSAKTPAGKESIGSTRTVTQHHHDEHLHASSNTHGSSVSSVTTTPARFPTFTLSVLSFPPLTGNGR